jgi:hypothetical protein
LEELPDELNRYQPGRAGFYAVLDTVPATDPELAADPPFLRQFVGPPIITPAARPGLWMPARAWCDDPAADPPRCVTASRSAEHPSVCTAAAAWWFLR